MRQFNAGGYFQRPAKVTEVENVLVMVLMDHTRFFRPVKISCTILSGSVRKNSS